MPSSKLFTLAAHPGPDFGTTALVVLCGYLLLLVWLGYLGYRRAANTEEDYYLAGRQQGWIVSSLTIMATFFSSFALLGAPGKVYQDGVVFALFALNVPVGAIVIFVLGSRIRRIGRARGYVTPGDMVSDYYDGSTALRLLVALIGLLYAVPYILIQMNAGGLVSQAIFPGHERAFSVGCGSLAVITLLYVMVGGMRSVAWTDVLQGSLLVFGMLLAGVAAVSALGGVSGFFDSVSRLPPESLSAPGRTGSFPPEKMLTVVVFASIGSMIQPAQWMRYYSAGSTRTLKRSALVFGTVLPFCFLFGVMLVGLGGQALYPPEVQVDGSLQPHHLLVESSGSFDFILIFVLERHLPELLGGLGVVLAALVCVAVMSASMSTADSSLHALSAVFTRDVYVRHIRRRAGDAERAWSGRIIMIVATLAAVVLTSLQSQSSAFRPYAMIAQMGFLAIAFSTQLLPVTIDILFLRRGTRAGAIAGIVTGLVTLFFFTPFFGMSVSDTSTGEDLLTIIGDVRKNVDLGCFALAGNVTAFIVVSRFTRKPDARTVEEFRQAAAGGRG